LNPKKADLSSSSLGNEDSRIVVDNSLSHSNAIEFDANYLEFLIQLQHRDITPEDYEYLTRLDEQIKKKTLDDAILDRLRTVKIDETSVSTSADECCGICLDGYQCGQFVKYLPCGHRFHTECIDNWLRNSSVNCPLDNLPIDGENVVCVTKNDCDDFVNDVGEIDFLEEDLLIEDEYEDIVDKKEISDLVGQMLDRVHDNLVLEDVELVLYEILSNFPIT
jgi:hypothetical protein